MSEDALRLLEDEEPVRKRRLSPVEKAILFVVVMGLLSFGYRGFLKLRDDARFHTCQANLNQIGKGMLLYLDDNGQRFPPPYQADDQGGVSTDSRGRPRTWVTNLYQRVQEGEYVFQCPSATEAENTLLTNPDPKKRGASLQLSYGMVSGLAFAKKDEIGNLGSVALVAETMRGGRRGSYDPKPLLDGNDGFLVGFDDSNEGRTESSRRVTRLALVRYGEEQTTDRHAGRGLVMLYVDGHVGVLGPDAMFVNNYPSLWTFPMKR